MKRLVAGLAVVSVLFYCPFVLAAEDPLPENQTQIAKEYTTNDPDFAEQFDGDFEASIEQDGQKYDLLGVRYSVLEEKALERSEPITHEVTYPDLYTQDAGAPEQLTIQKDGKDVTVTLTGVSYTPQTITNRSHLVTAYTDYGYQVYTPTPDEQKSVSYYDEATGQYVPSVLDFKELQEVDGYAWRNDVHIPMTVSVYDAQFYAIGDKLVPYNEKAPAVQGFEADILRSIGLDPQSYTIDTAVWMGEPYQSGETLCRDAVANGRRYAANYRAVYESEVALPDAQGWTAVATYEGESNILSGETEYTVQAVALYQRDDTLLIAVSISIAALILLAAIVVLLLLLMKKRKKKGE
mgnify:FL=1